jgi:hypothetical protein
LNAGDDRSLICTAVALAPIVGGVEIARRLGVGWERLLEKLA